MYNLVEIIKLYNEHLKLLIRFDGADSIIIIYFFLSDICEQNLSSYNL